MGELVFISGDFSSGTTLLFTMFRHTPGCCALYEPLHAKLPQYLIWPPRAYEGHHHVGNYYAEYKDFDRLSDLFDPSWSVSRLHLNANDQADELHRYLSYLIGTAFGRAPRVVLKDNRFTFRLAWLRAQFPQARIVNVFRDCEDQWQSWIRRAQAQLGREDVGQESVDFQGFRLRDWCEDLKSTFPELAAERSSTGYERFSKLWALSRQEHKRYSDVCVSHSELRNDTENALKRISAATGVPLDPSILQSYVITTPTRIRRPAAPHASVDVRSLIARAGRRYSDVRVAWARRKRAGNGSHTGVE